MGVSDGPIEHRGVDGVAEMEWRYCTRHATARTGIKGETDKGC
jgi:hypothetical protein